MMEWQRGDNDKVYVGKIKRVCGAYKTFGKDKEPGDIMNAYKRKTLVREWLVFWSWLKSGDRMQQGLKKNCVYKSQKLLLRVLLNTSRALMENCSWCRSENSSSGSSELNRSFNPKSQRHPGSTLPSNSSTVQAAHAEVFPLEPVRRLLLRWQTFPKNANLHPVTVHDARGWAWREEYPGSLNPSNHPGPIGSQFHSLREVSDPAWSSCSAAGTRGQKRNQKGHQMLPAIHGRSHLWWSEHPSASTPVIGRILNDPCRRLADDFRHLPRRGERGTRGVHGWGPGGSPRTSGSLGCRVGRGVGFHPTEGRD